MVKNMAFFERAIRYLVGLLLLTWAFAGGPRWAFLGLIPLWTAAFAYCPIYHLFNIGRVNSSPPTENKGFQSEND